MQFARIGPMSPGRFVTLLMQVIMLAVAVPESAAQVQRPNPPAATAPAPQAPTPEPATDPLGRHTPRGTVTGFIEAARKGNIERAAQYLNARGPDTETLARQLFEVLDARLPAGLMRISDAPEGSGSSLTPNREIVGTIEARRKQDIVLERVTLRDSPPIWLFSRETLDAIPELHDEIVVSISNRLLPSFLINTRIGNMRVVDILAVLLGLPAMYLATVLLNRVLTKLIRGAFPASTVIGANVLPLPARLLLVTVAATGFVATLPLSLAARQLWSFLASLLTSVTVAWLLILANGLFERYLLRRVVPSQSSAAASLLRLLRRGIDMAIVFGAILLTLRYYGIDPTPALAGLGVGGIAVALAAQKTLENVIAGASLIFDKAVRVGDFMRMGNVTGTVDHIGLRSTRIRTLDRTLVSVPNSQIANASLETLSARDKFWFHPVLGLRFETTPEQLHRVLDEVRRLLCEQPRVDLESVRVRFIRLGTFSLDIEVSAYFFASDWNHFLELQERLLSDISRIVNQAGTSFAFPSQTMYIDGGSLTVSPPGAGSAR